MGIRDRAILAVLAYSACRVGELVTLHVGGFRTSGEHRVLTIYGKGGKERLVPLHLEAVERLSRWIEIAGIGDHRQGPLFRPVATPRGEGHDGFLCTHLTTRAVEKLAWIPTGQDEPNIARRPGASFTGFVEKLL
jgi:integrase/recombinase XerD